MYLKLIGDTILRPLLETGPPFLRGHPSHAKVQPFAAQRQYLLTYFKTPSIGPAPRIESATSRSAVKRSTDWASHAANTPWNLQTSNS